MSIVKKRNETTYGMILTGAEIEHIEDFQNQMDVLMEEFNRTHPPVHEWIGTYEEQIEYHERCIRGARELIAVRDRLDKEYPELKEVQS